MGEKQRDFVKQKFSEYYRENATHIKPPLAMEKREFGFLLFNEAIMVRHKGFRTERDLLNFLSSLSPADVYYSSAYYERPEEKMGKKGWLGADLIFDIDSDHLETPCKNEHDYWLCISCNNTGTGIPPKQCTKCGGIKFKMETWLCEACLEAAKSEILRLTDFLIDDFGFAPEEIEVCFSGQRGYHAHIYSEEVRQLDQAARKEIVDYVSGIGFDVESSEFWKQISGNRGSRELIGPDLNDPGWQGRIANGINDLLKSSTPQQLEQLPGIDKASLRALIKNREFILKNWNEKTNWRYAGVDVKGWRQIIQYIINIHGVSAAVDSVVTTDIHRLIRLPRSLHGKTGLMAMNIPLDALKKFDPLKYAVAFKHGTLKVHINEAHQFRIGDEKFGPYDDETVVLPMAAAIYLLCKRAAEPVIFKN